MYKGYRSLLMNGSLTLIIVMVTPVNHFSVLSQFMNLEPLDEAEVRSSMRKDLVS